MSNSNVNYSALDTRYSLSAPLPTDGSTDVGVLIQAAYDAGAKMVKLSPGVTYLWDTPVFLDKNDVYGGMVIEGNRATIKLGSNLPTSTWSRDTTVKWALFPNNKRTALSGGIVTVNDANRATGTGGALRSLIVRDVTIDGQSANAGFSFANRTPITFENVTIYRMRVGATWWSYADANTFINCYSRASSNPSQVVFEQYQAGDGLVVVGGKADSNVMFANVKICRGGTFTGLVTCSITFDSCSAININGMHQEGQQSTSTMLQLKNSQVTLTNCSLYENWSATVPTILIDDSASTQTSSELTFDNVVCNGLFTASTYDTAFSPFLAVNGANDNTRVIARDLKGMHTSTGISGNWVDGAQPQITSNISAAQTALDSPRGRAAIASGTWTLRKIANGTWSVETTSEQLYMSKRHSVPTITQITTETGFTGGTMDSGSTYSYALAMSDALGNYTNVSAETNYAPGATAMTRLLINSQSGAGTLTVWRKAAASGASTTPDAYCIVNIRSQRAYFYDTGNYLGGRAWITTSIPTPPTVNATAAKVMLNGTALPTVADIASASSSGLDITPVDYNALAWAVNPTAITGSGALTSGSFKIVKAKVGYAGTPTTAIMNISVATSVSTTLFKIGVYAADGSQIGSASDSTVGSGTGQISLALTMGRALVAGETVYLGLLWVGTGTLSPSQTATINPNIGLNNSQATMYRISNLSSQTDLPASLSFSTYNPAGTINQILLR